ncbi:hypothetical protein CXP39_03610 [Mesoplasma syrphidae]|uniref:Uncharacterized protein n=1 Tax=Mesoplasma syrphidae TaxID=225999 RepID=A0A2K9BKW2_9MOLU|nr:hypothetical protein CXP39_03610 [Mesoplasma syrphidae]
MFKQTGIPFKSVLMFTLNSTFKSIRNYLFSIVLPTFITVAIYLIKTSFGNKDYSEISGQMYCLFIIPFTFSIFAFSSTITNWKESVLMKQSKIFSIGKTKIYLSIFVSILLLTFLAVIFCFSFLVFIDNFLLIRNFTNTFFNMSNFYKSNDKVKQYLTFFVAVLFIFFTFLMYMFLMFCMSTIVSFKIKSIVVIQALNLTLIILFLGLSDTIFDTNLITNRTAQMIYNTVGYLIPTKSFQWLLISLFTNTTLIQYNILETIVSSNLEIPFTFLTNKANLILPISLICSICWTLCIFLLSLDFKLKGEKKWKS